ncbi:MAG: GspH/FimT family pseudopilin [Candidatus Krumholzibacteriia bacterium]
MLRDKRGFNLVEIMVVISIFGLVAALSLPAFGNYVRSNRLSTSVNRLAADLQLARSTAIANGRVVQVTMRVDGYTITDLGTGAVVANRTFETGVALSAGGDVRFFPWGQADAQNFSVDGCNGATRVINLLPTGTVEVH